MRDLLFISIVAPLLVVCFFRPFLGILLWTVMSYLAPERYAFGFAHFLPVGYMTAIPTITGMVISGKFHAPPLTRETFLLGILWLWFAVTTINVYHSNLLVHHLPDTIQRFGDVTRILLMVIIAIILITDKNKLRWWYLITAGCFALLAFKALRFGLLTSGEARVYGPPSTDLADNNGFGLALNMSLPMFLYLARIETSMRVRLFFYLAFFAALVGVVLSYSRGALIGLFFLMLVLAIQSKQKIRAVIGVFVLCGVLAAAAPKQWIDRMSTLKTAQNTDASALERLNSWNFAAHLAYEFPILGGGFRTFTDPLYHRYGLSLLNDEGDQFGPHSIYFQMLAEHGFPGLFLFLALIASCMWSAFRVKRIFRRIDRDHWLVMYANMITGSLVAYVASGAFLGFAYFDLFYQIVGTTIVLKYLAKKEIQELTDAEEEASEPGESAELVTDLATYELAD
jgi:probable O-glycosylation ligase (exosortase A-associated)